MSKQQAYDITGIGIGVFNLSLAALLEKTKDYTYRFFDQKNEFSWHADMLLENSKLQVHFLKDLASCVDPANPYTFLSYLRDKNRIYQFLNRKISTVSRREFNDYFQWASKRIPGLDFGKKIVDIKFNNQKFNIFTENNSFYSKHIVVGTGIKPYIPEDFHKFCGKNFFHNSEFKQRAKELSFSEKRIAIIGGGQSGAEIFDTLISQYHEPEKITWISKQLNFQALENSSFTNEFYTPAYVNYFYSLPPDLQKKKLSLQRLSSDGITQELSDEIYNKLYEINYLDTKKLSIDLLLNSTLTNVKKIADEFIITLFNQDLQKSSDHTVDIVILATGYQSNAIECLKNLFPHIKNSGELHIYPDYSIKWPYDKTNKIFLQNGAKHTHGVADPNLSLAAWRNAIIINSLHGKTIYQTDSTNFIN